MQQKKIPFHTILPNHRRYIICLSLAFLIVSSIRCGIDRTGGWTTYRHDNARSGITTEELSTPLVKRWTFKPTHVPKPAWPKPGEEMERMHFDNAHHVTVADGMVYFGSPVDNKVYALNKKSGKQEWIFFTEGPVRYAPTIWKDRVYFGSDDGNVYCLRAKNGKSIWKYRSGPSDEKVLGNGRMVSLWPVRTSVLVDEGIAYFGAGVFPYEGVYMCALDADDGTVVWKNDTVGDRMHEMAFGGISPQSYLIISENILYVPSGRAMPAAFGRRSGEFLYYLLPGAKVGGTWALLDRERLITGVDHSGTAAKVAYDTQTGKKKSDIDDMHAWFPGIDLIVTPDVSYNLTEDGIYAMDREKFLILRSKKLKRIRDQQQNLTDRRSDLLQKISESEEESDREFNEQLMEDIEKKLLDLAAEEKRLKSLMFRWKYLKKDLYSIILTGDKLFAGGEGIVVALDTQTGLELWDSEVQGSVRGFAATKGNLFVSTNNGNIYCFGEGKKSKAKEHSPSINTSPYKKDRLTQIYEFTANKIIKETGIKKGYCLVLACGTGRLAYELAKRTELKIIGIEEDPRKVIAAKNKLDEAGFYGSRVVVERWDLSTLPDYFADLIVSEEMMISGEIDGYFEEVFRVLKPFGGVAYLGQPEEASKRGKALEAETLLEWVRQSGISEPEVYRENGIWTMVTRGRLEGAASWQEQYGSPQNTACSGDQLVKGPLGVLWFGEPGSERMVERHAKAASPVSMNGRLFVQGEEVIMAYNAYNGTLLWERKIPGAVRARADVDGGNLAVAEDALYVAARDRCYCLDPATGETVQVFEVPQSSDGSTFRWGYVSCADNMLYGSRAMPLNRDYFALWEILVENGRWKNSENIPPELREQYESLKLDYPEPDEKLWADFKRSGALWHFMADFPEWEIYDRAKGALTENIMISDMIFAMNSQTGELQWQYRGERIAHITVTRGDGKVFFAESTVSEKQKRRALKDRQKLIVKGIYERSEEGDVEYGYTDVRIVVCLDAVTGDKLWEKPLDLTECGGDAVGTAYSNGVLLFFANVGSHDAWRHKTGTLRWKRITALSDKTGDVLWSHPNNYRTRPVVVGNRIFIEPRVCDLHSGEIITRSHPISGKQVPWEYLRPGHTCAITSASAHALFYRSYSTAIYDFTDDRGLALFGGIRPGCWINILPANGLLLFPEASAGCTCSFPLRCSVALKHKKKRAQPWTVFITHGSMTPVKHFAINLGAPADMKDKEGTLWFAYPNPKTDYVGNHYPNYGVKFDLQDEVLQGMGYFCSDFKNTDIEGSHKPWLFTSGCLGLLRCEVPLVDDIWGEKPGVYTVRLGFYALSNDRVDQRVFNIMLQGDPVMENLDVFKEAGASNKAVIKEFKGINVENKLLIELSSKETNPTIDQAPLINFIEVIREDIPEDTETQKSVSPITMKDAEFLLREAKEEFGKGNYEAALEKYHTVLDSAASIDLKRQALEGMAAIKSSESLSRIAKFCRDTEPILWNYKEPDPQLKIMAMEAFIAIADKIARTDKPKAIKMLKHAMMIADADIRKQALTSLKNLGVDI